MTEKNLCIFYKFFSVLFFILNNKERVEIVKVANFIILKSPSIDICLK